MGAEIERVGGTYTCTYVRTSNNREPYIDTYTQCIRDWESEAR